MRLTQLIYISRSCIAASSPEMAAIENIAKSRNALRDVTGFLYYDDQAFVQVLEGPAEAVDEIFAKIDTDPRHQDVRVLEHGWIEERQFGDWAMGLYNGSLYSGLLRLAFGERFVSTITPDDSVLLHQFLRDLSLGDDGKYRVLID